MMSEEIEEIEEDIRELEKAQACFEERSERWWDLELKIQELQDEIDIIKGEF